MTSEVEISESESPSLPAVDEVAEFVTTLFATPPTQLTNCRNWTAHDLVAHLAAGAAEEADLIEARIAGAPDRSTRPFDVREGPYRALADPALRERLLTESVRLAAAVERLGDGEVFFTGRSMTATDISMHSRSECALHRWDLVGRDDVGWAMLANQDLTRHAVSILTSMPALNEAPTNRLRNRLPSGTLRVVVRSAPNDDIVITASEGECRIALSPADDSPADLEMSPAHRLLMLWGRHEPSSAVQLHAVGPARELVVALLD